MRQFVTSYLLQPYLKVMKVNNKIPWGLATGALGMTTAGIFNGFCLLEHFQDPQSFLYYLQKGSALSTEQQRVVCSHSYLYMTKAPSARYTIDTVVLSAFS
jgi:hypothetical protein